MTEEAATERHGFWHELFLTIRSAFKAKLFWAVAILLTVNYIVGGVSVADLVTLLQGVTSFAASLVPGL